MEYTLWDDAGIEKKKRWVSPNISRDIAKKYTEGRDRA